MFKHAAGAASLLPLQLVLNNQTGLVSIPHIGTEDTAVSGVYFNINTAVQFYFVNQNATIVKLIVFDRPYCRRAVLALFVLMEQVFLDPVIPRSAT